MSGTERDRELGEAWRRASREEPPARLDEAIRAEARRAVSAAPERARRHRQWRYPAAAAAAVGLLAFGIAQMTPRDEIEPVIVADQASAARSATPSSAPTPAQPAASARTPDATTALPEPSSKADRAASTADAKAPAPAAPAAGEPPPSTAKRAVPRKEEASNDRFAPAPSAADARGSNGISSAAPSSAREATALRRKSAPAAEAAPATRETLASNAAPSEPFPAGTQAGSAPAQARRDEPSRDAYPQSEQPGSPATRRASGGMQQHAIVGPPAVAVAKVSNLDEAKAKQAGEQGVDAWIARIRELQRTGQFDAAARELERFRAIYGDRASVLLPPDLRGVTASDAKGQ